MMFCIPALIKAKRIEIFFTGQAQTTDVNIGFYGKPLSKTGFKPLFVLLTSTKIYYIEQIMCITHCNVHVCTCKAVSTPNCSFSRFSLNEVMNIVFILCVL